MYRRKASYWHNIGFVEKQSHIHNYKDSNEKNLDYQFMIYELLRDLRKVNENGVLQWTFIHNRVKKVILEMPILFIIGDAEGHDKL
jgi:hypothetical protein